MSPAIVLWTGSVAVLTVLWIGSALILNTLCQRVENAIREKKAQR